MRHRTNTWLNAMCGVSLAVFVCGPVSHAAGGIATDGTVGGPGALGHPQTLGGSKVTITENLGSKAGKNLFHSFSTFNITSGQTVTFTEDTPNSLDNVITRVTGRTTSDIDGALQSTPGGHASFYLINPSGVTFGRGAQIDVPGDFHVSTADHLKFKDGARFSATHPNHSTLSSAEPAAFGFLGTSKANNGLLKVEELTTSKTYPGKSFDAVSGEIHVNPAVGEQFGILIPFVREIRLVAVQGKTDVSLKRTPEGNLPLPSAWPSKTNAGRITIQHSAVNTSPEENGRIGIWGGRVSLDQSSIISFNETNAHPSDGSTIKARNLVLSDVSVIGTGGGPLVLATSRNLKIGGGSILSSRAASHGASGATPAITLKSKGNITMQEFAFITTGSRSGGPGDVVIRADGNMTMKSNASIFVDGRRDLDAGNVDIRVGGGLTVRDGASVGAVAALGWYRKWRKRVCGNQERCAYHV